MTTPQLPLGFPPSRPQRFEDYVPGANAAVVAALEDAARDTAAPWHYLAGPSGSGRTHLLLATCDAARRPTRYLPLAALAERAEGALIALGSEVTALAGTLLAIDDVDALAGARGAEIALFDTFNRAREHGLTLVIAARAPARAIGFGLPDLVSRLSSITQWSLQPLGDTERRALLRARAQARGFELDEDVIEFLFRRHARDLGSLLALLDQLDRESLAQQRRVTVPFLRRVLGVPRPPDAGD